MNIITTELNFETKGFNDIIDLTEAIQNVITENNFTEGNATIFAVGSTTGLTMVEFEPGLVKTDLPEFFEKLAPYKADYAHHKTWGDDNGASHVRSSLLGSSLVIPFANAKLILGTWQQVIFVDFDTSSRSRRVIVQIIGISG